jgi:hypothetical protein
LVCNGSCDSTGSSTVIEGQTKGILIFILFYSHKLNQSKSLPLKHYKVLQHLGGLGSGTTVRVTFLSFLSKKKRKKVTKRFEIKEKFSLNKQQRDLRLKKILIQITIK